MKIDWRVVAHCWQFGCRQAWQQEQANDHKDSEHDQPRIPGVEHMALGVGQPSIGGNWYMLHCDGMIDVTANDADLRLVSRNNDSQCPANRRRGSLSYVNLYFSRE